MEYFLGVDVGDKRIGLALGTESPSHVFPLGIFDKAAYRAESEIIRIVNEKKIKIVIVGMPLDEQGKATEQCRKIKTFCNRLKKRLDITIKFVDEYFSSQEAGELLKSTKNSHGKVDAVAAAVILKSYFENPQNLVDEII